MRQLQPVIWSKGTLLSPQHLQAQERFVQDTLRFYMESLGDVVWGFGHLQPDPRSIADGILTVVSARGVFPDAAPFDFPACEPAPASRALEPCFANGRTSCTFFLAVPEYRLSAMNIAVNRSGVSTRFKANVQWVRDETASGTREKPIQVAQKNLQLLAEGESLEGAVLLPCARVLRTETGAFAEDATFVPPLLDLHASVVLENILRGLLEMLVTRGAQLTGARQGKREALPDFSAADIVTFWLLYTINSHLPRLRHLLQTAAVTPSRLFQELSHLAGSLAAFSKTIDPRDLPRYTHEDPGPPFRDLDAKIRIMLDTVVPTQFVALPLRRLRDAIYTTAIERDDLLENTRLYLGVRSDLRNLDVIERAPKLLKLSSATQIEDLVRHALPGMRLMHVAHPPRAIPVKVRQQYFALEQSGQAWASVLRARNFAVYAPSEFLNPSLELIILLPETASSS